MFEEFLRAPLAALAAVDPRRLPIVLLIDGLDEGGVPAGEAADADGGMLALLSLCVHSPLRPIRINSHLVCCRSASHGHRAADCWPG